MNRKATRFSRMPTSSPNSWPTNGTIFRFIATIKLKEATASQLFKRLNSDPRQTAVSRPQRVWQDSEIGLPPALYRHLSIAASRGNNEQRRKDEEVGPSRVLWQQRGIPRWKKVEQEIAEAVSA